MSDALYHEAIKALAKSANGAGRLAAADATVRLDNPLCGDRVTLDVSVANGRVTAIGHETRGCLLCLAAASLIGKYAPGISIDDALGACRRVGAVLTESTSGQSWPDLAVFTPVAAYPARHGCVLLPFHALERALGLVSPSRHGTILSDSASTDQERRQGFRA